jgi:hypothetical protein
MPQGFRFAETWCAMPPLNEVAVPNVQFVAYFGGLHRNARLYKKWVVFV